MKVTGSIFDKYVLSKFLKISKLATSYDAVENPLWSSIIFDKENQRILYLGWSFAVELKYPVEQDFIVNFSRFRDAVRSCKKPWIEASEVHNVNITDDEGTLFKLRKLKLDYSNFLPIEPKNLEWVSVDERFTSDLEFCTVSASTDRYDYTRFGVIAGEDVMYAMDANASIAIILSAPSVFPFPVLIQLPWCEILPTLGAVTHASAQDLGGQNAMLFFKTTDDFKVTIPALKIQPNPSIIPYVQSLEPQVQLTGLNKKILKKLEVTTDDAYKFCTIYSQDDGTDMRIILETQSKTKGRTSINLCAGDMYDEAVSVSLAFLYKVLELGTELGIDLDNNVGVVTKGESGNYKYAFSLG